MFLKSVLLLSLLSSLLVSNTLSISSESIQTLFDKNEYDKACELAYELYKQQPNDFKANLFYGKCAEHRGDTDTAMAAYDRAEILNEENFLVHKYLGDLYAKIGNIEIAHDEYDKADRFGDAPVARAAITQHDPHRLSLLLCISAGVDSNVKYNADRSDMDEWFGDANNSSNTPESVLFAKEYLRITHVYDSDPFTSFYYKSQQHGYNKNYETYHNENLAQGQLYTGPGWASNTFDLWLPVSYTYVATGYYDHYSDIFSAEPQIRIRFENKILLKIEAYYANEQFKQWDEGDRTIYSGGLTLSRWFGDNYFRAAYRYLKADKDDADSPRIFIDKYFNEIDLNYVRAVTPLIEAGIGYLFRNSVYDDLARASLPANREDELHQYSGYISYDLSEYTGLVLQYDYYDNQTNHTPSDYTKEVISAGVYFYF